jgi:hypothetical protein
MRRRICPSCGGDTSTVPAKKRPFAQFLVKVVRCPHCGLRNTLIAPRKERRIHVVFRAVTAEPRNRTGQDCSGNDLKIRAEKARQRARALGAELKAAVAELQHIKDKLLKAENKTYACADPQRAASPVWPLA